jgi:hypothetical protein
MGQHTVSGPQRIQLDQPVTRLDVTLVRGRVSVVGAPGGGRMWSKAVRGRLGSGGILDATSTSGNVALLASE